MTRRRLLVWPMTWLVAGFCAVSACGDSPVRPGPMVNPPPIDTPAPSPPAPPPPAPPPTLGVTRVLAFGDSLTWGTTQPPAPWRSAMDPGISQSYPFKLQALINERYTDQTIQVFNFGEPGRRAADDRDRFNDAMAEARPDLVLLLEGANDLNQPFAAGEGINERINSTVGALEDMVRDAGFRSLPVLLGTLPPQREGGRRAGAASYLTRFNDAVKTMAQKKGAHLVDIGSELPLSLIGADGLHPTEAGYDRMAEIWLEAVKGRYERAPSSPAAAEQR